MSESKTSHLRDRNYRVKAIVIGRSDFGESDRVYTLFSLERGKIRAVAKGVRRPKSRLQSGLDFFCTSSLYISKGRGLDIITSATIVSRPFAEGHSLDSIGYVSHLAEMTSRMMAEDQESESVYDLLSGAISAIDLGIDPDVVIRSFELGLLKHNGYNIDLYHCTTCGKSLQETSNLLSPVTGGFVCEDCRSPLMGGRVLSVNAQKFLRVVDRQGIQAAQQLRLPFEVVAELDVAMRDFLKFVIERDPASLRVLQELRESTPRYSVDP
jgi:DNA repair protein RecO (recombination protein O)